MEKLKNILRLIAGQIVIAIALLALLDALLWLTAPIPNGTPPLAKHFTQNIPGLKPEIIYDQIENGFRSSSIRSLSKSDAATRILCIGASTTKQNTQETADTWCALLESKLEQFGFDPTTKIHTLGYGNGGDRAADVALWFARTFDKIKPDIVITLFGINDLAWNGGPDYHSRNVKALIQEEIDRERNKTVWARTKDKCKDISQLCRRAALAATNIAARNDLRKEKTVEWHSDNLPTLRKKYQRLPYVDTLTRQPDPLEEFGGGLEWILQFLKEKNTPVIVLGQPVIWKDEMSADEYDKLWFWINTPGGPVRPSTSWLLQQMQKYNQLQREVAEKYGFSYVDLDAIIPKSLDYYFDDCHYTDKGSARVAEAVLPALRQVLDARGIRAPRP